MRTELSSAREVDHRPEAVDAGGIPTAHDESIAFRKAKAPYERLAALAPVPPLLAIFGAEDAIVPPDQARLWAKVPGARVEMIEGSGHSPMVEAPAKTLALIRGFLAPVPVTQ